MSSAIQPLSNGNAITRATAFDADPFQLPSGAGLPEIRISRETCQFQLPSGEYVKSLRGNILAWHYANAYWKSAFGESEQKFPTCLSPDGRVPADSGMEGYERQSETCSACALNQFGSDGAGKACANSMLIYILLQGNIIPSVIRVTATSLGGRKPLERWFVQAGNDSAAVLGKAILPAVCVEIGLDRAKSADGFDIAIVHPTTLGVLTDGPELQMLETVYVGCRQHWQTSTVARRMVNEAKPDAAAPVDDAPKSSGPIHDDTTLPF